MQQEEKRKTPYQYCIQESPHRFHVISHQWEHRCLPCYAKLPTHPMLPLAVSRYFVFNAEEFRVVLQGTESHFSPSFVHIWFVFYWIDYIFPICRLNLGTI